MKPRTGCLEQRGPAAWRIRLTTDAGPRDVSLRGLNRDEANRVLQYLCAGILHGPKPPSRVEYIPTAKGSTADIARWRVWEDWRREHGESPESAEGYVNFLSARKARKTVREHVRIASRQYMLARAENPFLGVTIGGARPKQRRALTDDEVERLLRVASRFPEWAGITVLCIDTGQRLSDCVRATAESVKDGVWTVTQSKTGHVVTVPLTQRALDLFQKCPAGPLFARTSHDLRQQASRIWKMTQRIVREAGLADACFHCLRHTFASRLSAAGVHPDAIRALTGHAWESMRLRYTHVDLSTLRDAVSRLEK